MEYKYINEVWPFVFIVKFQVGDIYLVFLRMVGQDAIYIEMVELFFVVRKNFDIMNDYSDWIIVYIRENDGNYKKLSVVMNWKF